MTAKGLRTCPNCQAMEGIRIIYGFPPLEVIYLHEKGEVLLGECTRGRSSPDWHCRACGHQWAEARNRPGYQ